MQLVSATSTLIELGKSSQSTITHTGIEPTPPLLRNRSFLLQRSVLKEA